MTTGMGIYNIMLSLLTHLYDNDLQMFFISLKGGSRPA